MLDLRGLKYKLCFCVCFDYSSKFIIYLRTKKLKWLKTTFIELGSICLPWRSGHCNIYQNCGCKCKTKYFRFSASRLQLWNAGRHIGKLNVAFQMHVDSGSLNSREASRPHNNTVLTIGCHKSRFFLNVTPKTKWSKIYFLFFVYDSNPTKYHFSGGANLRKIWI